MEKQKLSLDNPKFSFAAIREMITNSLRLAKILWQEKRGTTFAIGFFLLFVSIMPFFASGVRGLVINELVKVAGGRIVSDYLLLLITALLLFGFLPPLFSTIQNYFSRRLWLFLGEHFEIWLLERTGSIDVALHEDPKHSDLFTKVRENGVFRIQNFVDRQFFLVANIIEVLAAAVIIFAFQWWIFLVIFIAMIPELFAEISYGQRVWGIFNARAEVRRRYWSMQRHFNWLPWLIELKVFQNTRHFLSRLSDLLGSFMKEQAAIDRKKLLIRTLTAGLSQTATAFTSGLFIFQVINGNLQIGTLTFLLASLGSLRQSLSGFFGNLGRQYQDSLFVTDIFKLIDTKPAIFQPKPGIMLPDNHTPEIIFENVTFVYPGRDTPVLKNFSLTIAPGEKIALVGGNGAGKTTLIKLLCRFYDPTEGRILVNGSDLRHIDLESFYHLMGVLFQDYASYHFVVKEAIGVGRMDKQNLSQKVKEAAHASEADIFIEEWEKKYEQMLGKEFTGGVQPSIGQWQKLALARTFYRDPRVFILDEPTSSIDAESEAKIFEKLESLPDDRSVILISHRFSTVRQANRICVIEDGHASEIGTHQELLKKNGTYARLFKIQAKGYQ